MESAMQQIPLNQRVAAIPESATLAVSAKAKAMKRQGLDVVGFGVGEPDFDTPEHIKQAAVNALSAGNTKYTPASGTPELRNAIVEKLKNDNQLDYDPSQIVVSNGAKHSLFNAVLALVRQGDEVLIPSPYWVTYPEQVKLAGGVPVIVPTSADDGYRLRPDAIARHIHPGKTRLLILNSPSNPTGAVLTPQTLTEIGTLCLEAGVSVIADEIYEKLVYNDKQHLSILKQVPELQETSILINGVSKAYAMTGWRIGYLAAPKHVAKAIGRLQGQATSGPSSISQAASLAALTGDQSCVAEMREQFDARRKLIMQRVADCPGLSAPEPDGAFYLFVSFADLIGKTLAGTTINGSLDFCNVLLEQAHVAAVPGIAFGDDNGFRLSYATSTDNINKGLDRIEKLLSNG